MTNAAGSARPSVNWGGVLRHGLQVLALCSVIAVFTTLLWPQQGYARQLLHSVCIGGLTWLTIEFGRLLVPPAQCDGPLDGRHHGWPRGWRGLLLTVIGIGVGFAAGTRLAALLLGESLRAPQRDLLTTLLITIAGSTLASFYFHARGRQAALQAEIAAAQRDASEARLKLLQSQLEPHMLFNTLANLRALIGIDPPAAQQMLDRLNHYLRATLSASRATWHPLATEFERLDDYLALMAVRMGARLRCRLTLPEALRAVPVPPLLLQPLVENAIAHGLEPQVQGGQIEVAAERQGEHLLISVYDSGAGFDPAAARAGGGFGLAQVFERVASAYGGRAQVQLQSAPGAGTTVRLRLPLAGASAAAAGTPGGHTAAR